jgi:hypothetical protein
MSSSKSPVRALIDERIATLRERLEGLERAEEHDGIVMTGARDVAVIREELAFLVELMRRLGDERDEYLAFRRGIEEELERIRRLRS